MSAMVKKLPGRPLDRARATQRQRATSGQTDEALAALFESGAAGIAEVDLRSGGFVRVNRRFCEIMKRDRDLLFGLGVTDVVHPEDRGAVDAAWRAAMETTGQWEAEVRHVWPDGGEFWVRIGVSASRRDASGAPVRCVAVLQDVTDSVRAKERLKNNEELLRLGQRVGRIGSFTRDLRTGSLECSAETRHMLGLAPHEGAIPTRSWMAGFLAQDRPRLAETIDAALKRRDPEIAIECRIRRRNDGVVRHLEMRARYFYDEAGEPIRSVGVVIDVTERKEAEEKFVHAARHDALTGLPNRALFHERLNEATANVRDGAPFAVFCLDLDRFKDVNDTLGHPQGDSLLIETAARLRAELRPGDMLARLGGDEFAVIQSGLSDREEAAELARRLVVRIAEPFTLKGQRVIIGASIGVALAPHNGAVGEDLLIAADLALYKAKGQATRGWRFFEPQMNEEARLRRELAHNLRKGFDSGEFELFYQPVLDASTLRVRRFEALARWRHPLRGLVAPDRFIPLCEEIGLICPLGAWVLRRACDEATTWPAAIGVSVNISAVQVAAGDLHEVVAAALAESGLAAERLELEITETALLKDCESTLAALHKLKALGVRIAMDNFGAGQSSLGYLQSFPFDKVKIDRAFATCVDQSPRAAAIVKAMLNLCSALGMSTTIEGVETEAQFQALAKLGADRVQGFLFSPPRPAHGVPALLAQFGGSPTMSAAAE